MITDTQIRVMASIEPEMCMQILRNLSEILEVRFPATSRRSITAAKDKKRRKRKGEKKHLVQVGGKACCRVANAFLSRSELIRPFPGCNSLKCPKCMSVKSSILIQLLASAHSHQHFRSSLFCRQ